MLFDPYSLLPPMGWLAVAILSLSIWSLLIRVLMREEKDFLASTTSSDIFSIIYMIFAISVLGANFGFSSDFDVFSLSAEQLLLPAAASILYTGFMYYTFKGSQQVEGAIRPVIGQTQNIWVVIISLIFLGEVLDLQKGFAIFLIMLGSILSVFRKSKMPVKLGGTELILIASVFVAGASVVDKIGLIHFPALIYTLPMYIVPPFVFSIMMGAKVFERISIYLKKYFAKTILLAFFSVLAYVSSLLALSKLEVSVVVPLLNTFVILTAIGGMIFLGEKNSWQFKIIGAILAFIGAVLIS